ncbi:hypothetical protein GCM10009624_26340 [Gordonia sinesedis]
MTTSSPAPESLAMFLRGAAHSAPAVGLTTPGSVTTAVAPTRALRHQLPAGFVARVVDGARMRTLSELYREFAHAWRFPEYFGNNKDAFDECMRDLEDFARDADDPTPAGFVTVVTEAQDLLTDAPDNDFRWFATRSDFYREHYRDIARPPAVFAVILGTPPTDESGVMARWRHAGASPARLSPLDTGQ